MLPEVFHDFRKFVFHVWRTVNLPRPTAKQYEIANISQNVIKSAGILKLPPDPNFTKDYPMLLDTKGKVTHRLVIEAFRGIGKSWLSSTLAAWCLGINPLLNIMALSAAKQKSDEFTTFCLQLLRDIPELNFLLPDKSLGDRCSSLAFDVRGHGASQAPSVRSIGIFGQVTGGRADIAFPDDIEVPKTAETQLLREKLAERVSEIGGAVLKPDGVVIYLGTPQCEETVYDILERDRGYKKIIFPSRFPSDKWMTHNGHALAPSIQLRMKELGPKCQTGCGIDGTRGWPTDTRFNELELQDRELEHGRTGFDLQYQLDTSLSDAERYPLRLRDLIVMDIGEKVPASLIWTSDPDFAWKDLDNVGFRGDRFYRPMNWKMDNQEWLPLKTCAMFIDPAGRGKDELGYAIAKTVNGLIFLKASGGFKHGYEPATLKALAELAKKHGVNEIIEEPNFGDGMFAALLAPYLRDIYPCSIIESEWSTVQKEKRICDTLEPVCNQHMLVVDPEVIRSDRIAHPEDDPQTSQMRSLFFQFTRITRERGSLRHDDRLDALAGVVSYFKKNLGIDKEKAQLDRKLEYYKKLALDCQENNALRPRRPDKPCWLKAPA